MQDRMLRWFDFAHLPLHLRVVSEPFGTLAREICARIPGGPERTVALRKLLEAKDAAVRAVIEGDQSTQENRLVPPKGA